MKHCLAETNITRLLVLDAPAYSPGAQTNPFKQTNKHFNQSIYVFLMLDALALCALFEREREKNIYLYLRLPLTPVRKKIYNRPWWFECYYAV